VSHDLAAAGAGSAASRQTSAAPATKSDADRPAAGRRTRDRDVAAEADEDGARRRGRSRARGAIGRERLRGRAEIELDPRRSPDDAAHGIEVHSVLPRGRHEPEARAAGGDEGEVAIPPERAQRRADRRVDAAAGRLGRAERDADGLDEERPGGERLFAGAVQPAQLGVVAEAAARGVDRSPLSVGPPNRISSRCVPAQGRL